MIAALLSLCGVLLGAPLGFALARRGVTAETALEGRKPLAYAIIASAAAIAGLLYFRQRVPWLPDGLSLWLEELMLPGAELGAGVAFGLILFLEWPGRKDRKRRRTLVLALCALSVCLAFLFHRGLPIDGILQIPTVYDDVVLQTTPYTCAAASIATIARHSLGDTTVTERVVVELAGTTRAGTSTLREMKALRALGFNVRFSSRLTVDSLMSHGGPAVLHVNEPVATGTIRHAVALLSVDEGANTLTVGNPLTGRQVMRLDQVEGYWIGEAVLVSRM